VRLFLLAYFYGYDTVYVQHHRKNSKNGIIIFSFKELFEISSLEDDIFIRNCPKKYYMIEMGSKECSRNIVAVQNFHF